MKKNGEKHLVSRKMALAFQALGVLIFIGASLLQCMFAFSRGTLIFYYGAAFAVLAFGVLERRMYDGD